jgi:hypothetical protein
MKTLNLTRTPLAPIANRCAVLATLVAVLAATSFSAAQAALLTYTAVLDGASEATPNASPGTGFAQVDIDDVALTMHISVVFGGLQGTTTAAHIHAATTVAGAGTAGVATTTPTFAGFPSGVTSGTYDNTLDLTQVTSYNPSFITAHGGTTAGAAAFLIQSIADGKAYFNIHTNMFPGGEIRGFLAPSATPTSPAAWGGVKALFR